MKGKRTLKILATDGLGFRGIGVNHFWGGGGEGRSRRRAVLVGAGFGGNWSAKPASSQTRPVRWCHIF